MSYLYEIIKAIKIMTKNCKLVLTYANIWVGKQLQSGEYYSPSANEIVESYPIELVLEPTLEELQHDIKKYLRVDVSNTGSNIIKHLAQLLISKDYGMIYCQDNSAEYNVRKIFTDRTLKNRK